SGILTGSPFGSLILTHQDSNEMRNLGHFFAVINPDMFVGKKQFKKQMKYMVSKLHELRPIEGFNRVMVPGEPEQQIYNKRLRDGIPIMKTTYDYLKQTIN